jgi:hypothetical protein
MEYPGAWDHMMNRGRRADDVFTGKSEFYWASEADLIYPGGFVLMNQGM